MEKTAEEILKKYTDIDDGIISTYDYNVISAMEEYASQQPVPQQTGGELWQWVKASEMLPDYDTPVFVKMKWESGKEIGAYLKRVNEDDVAWRTVDDNSEISYSLTVIEWLSQEQTGGYSKELKENLLSWLMGNRILDPSSANIIIDHFERYAHPSPTAPSDAWISVDDRLPDDIQDVLVYGSEYKYNNIKTAFYDDGWKGINSMFLKSITHWQPLPSPPNK